MLLKRAHSNERRGGGAVLSLVFTFDCHSIGQREIRKCRNSNETLRTAHDTILFIYLSHFKMKFRIVLNCHFELLVSKGLN